MSRRRLAIAATLLCACGSAAPVPPAPPPRRPEPIKVPPPPPQATDCPVIDVAAQAPAVPYAQRSIAESSNLAVEAAKLIKRGQTEGLSRVEREELITEAVHTYLTALAADPYNVNATYSLAAVYARIGRRQCTLNLLERLLLLRKLPSQQPAVESRLDRMLGQDRYKGQLDPDFNDLRDDPAFRELVKKFQPPL
jgi:hypothetical protein